MNKKSAFTIIELMIALFVSSIIIFGVMQSLQYSKKILLKTYIKLSINKSVCLFFNQIERDFNCALIPLLAKEEKTQKEENPKHADNQEKEKNETIFFIQETFGEENQEKINDKKYELFKKISFVNTNPFQVWGERKTRLVRIGYELVKNNQKSTRTNNSYDLYRQETNDPENTKFKEPEIMVVKKQPDFSIKRILIATNIKSMFIECRMPKPEEKDKKIPDDATEDERTIHSFVWGTTKETKNVVPQSVELHISFWNDDLTLAEKFSCVIPVFTYPTVQKKNSNNTQKSTESTTTQTNAPQRDAIAPQPPSNH